MAELAVVDHSADHLDYAVGHVELDHADHAPFGVVYHGARRAVDPGQPEAAEEPVRAEQADEEPFDALRPASGFRATCALPLPSAWTNAGCQHAEKRVYVPARGGNPGPAGPARD